MAQIDSFLKKYSNIESEEIPGYFKSKYTFY